MTALVVNLGLFLFLSLSAFPGTGWSQTQGGGAQSARTDADESGASGNTMQAIDQLRSRLYGTRDSQIEQGFQSLSDIFSDQMVPLEVQAASQPKTAEDVIAKIHDVRPNLFMSGHLASHYQEIEAAIHGEFLEGERADTRIFHIFRQWVFIEIYKAYRLEYLMFNFWKALVQSEDLTIAEAQAEFDVYLPEEMFEGFYELGEARDRLYDQIASVKGNQEEVDAARDYLVGVLEWSYIGSAICEKRRRYLELDFDPDSDDYLQEIAKLDAWKTNLLNSSSLLATETFEEGITDLTEDELDDEFMESIEPVRNLTRKAVRDFEVRFQEHTREDQTLYGMVDFLTSDETVALGESLAVAFSHPAESDLRQRIKALIPEGLNEILENLRESLEEHREEFAPYDVIPGLLLSNVWTARDPEQKRSFHDWLDRMMREEGLRWIITRIFPFLQSSDETLQSFANREAKRRNWDKVKRYSYLAGLMVMSRLPKMTSAMVRLLNSSRWVSLLGKLSIFGAELYLTYRAILDAKEEYHRWREVQRLSRLAVEGGGLVTLAYEENTYRRMWWHIGMAAFATGATASYGITEIGGFFRKAARLNEGWLRESARSTWLGDPLTLADLKANSLFHLRGLGQSIRSLQVVPSLTHSAMIAQDLATFVLQFGVALVEGVNPVVKGFLGQVANRSFDALTLGTVMGIMSVTVSHIINASVVDALIYVVEKFGFTPPAYWKQNSLNWEERTLRMANLSVHDHLQWGYSQISIHQINLAQAKHALEDPNLEPDLRSHYNDVVAAAQMAIKRALFIIGLLWYEKIEYRDLIMKAAWSNGYQILPFPVEDPVRVTVSVQLGDRLISYTPTIEEFEMAKRADAQSGESIQELQHLFDQLITEEDFESLELESDR